MHEAENDEMAVGVILQVVDFRLLEVAEIADAEDVSLDGEVEGEHLPQGRGVEWRGEHDVVVVVSFREKFVVALAVVGTEEYAQQGQGRFVLYGGAHLLDVEEITGRCAGGDVQIDACLCGIVSVAGIVEKAAADLALHSGFQFQAVAHQVPMAVAGIDKAIEPVEVVGVFRAGLAYGYLGLMGEGGGPAGGIRVATEWQHTGREGGGGHFVALRLVDEAEFKSVVVFGREVGVEDIGRANAEHLYVGYLFRGRLLGAQRECLHQRCKHYGQDMVESFHSSSKPKRSSWAESFLREGFAAGF